MKRYLLRGLGFAISMSLITLIATLPIWLPGVMLWILGGHE